MNQQELIAYLSSKIEFKDWQPTLEEELHSYKNGLKKQGSSVPIQYDGDIKKVRVGKKEIKRLCKDFSDGIIDEYFIGYIADAILLSENSVYENEEIRDKLESLSELVNNESKKERFYELLCT